MLVDDQNQDLVDFNTVALVEQGLGKAKFSMDSRDQTLKISMNREKNAKMDLVIGSSTTDLNGLARQGRVGVKSALVKRKSHRHTASLQHDRRSRVFNQNQHQYEGLPADPLRGSSPGAYNSTTSISETYGNGTVSVDNLQN